jgi:hypothetical protein
MLENIVYTILDQSAIFQLAILSSLADAREYNYHVLPLKNQALSSLFILFLHIIEVSFFGSAQFIF